MPLADLWIPESAREKRRVCGYCGTEFPWDKKRAWRSHVLHCDRQHGEQLEEHAAVMAGNAFTGILDKEQYAYKRRKAAEKKER